ncbi:hypothetical protein [Sphingomonas sp. KR3-1]|uniref:hypothetical protein n=1 Tax=Sphingomonas sp. KR3-1 TaxID=3156611 RepID=UPI0032B38A38
MDDVAALRENVGPAERGRSLAGQRILFIAVRDFGYAQQITDELRRRGAEVDYLLDRPFDTPIMSAATRYMRPAIMPFADRYYFRKLAELGNKEYTQVFVLNGVTVSTRLLAALRARMPRARFLFYIWDSMRNRPSAPALLPYFDDKVTFDPEAAEQYDMRLRPLFFAPGFETPADGEPEYDLSFIGTAHSDRYHIISTLGAALGTEVKPYWYLFLKAPWVFYAEKLMNPAFKRARRDDFKYETLGFAKVQQVFRKSRAIVDIEHPHQMGLTMRTFEALGSGKKLITTNTHVRDYPFYDSQNMHVIDRANPSLPDEFLKTPYRPLPQELYYQYSLAGWVDSLMGSDGAAGTGNPK